MSLALAAQHLQAQGRGNDTHLVHMTSGELQSLRHIAQMHGGDLTVNPKTGLPEAGFLGAILPTVLGVAGAAFLPEIDPMILGAGIGVADYAMTGSLMNGVMAGFGAYSGGKLGTDISNFGAAAVPDVPIPSISTPTDIGVEGQLGATSGQGIQLQPLQEGQSINDQSYLNQYKTGLPAVQQASASLGNLPNFGLAGQPNFGAGLDRLSSMQGISDFIHTQNYGMDALKAGLPLGMYALQQAMKPSTTTGAPVATSSSVPSANQLKYNAPNFQATIPTPPNPPYQATYPNYVTNPYNPYAVAASAGGGLQHVKKMAKGDYANMLEGYEEYEKGIEGLKRPVLDLATAGPGIYHDPEQGMDTATPLERSNLLFTMASKHLPKKQLAAMIPPKATDLTSIPTQTALEAQQAADAAAAQSIAQSPQATSAKEGGLQNLGHYSDGGHLLKGPGDGVSDSIPATIGGKQPARLADGEFVIPARIVSELGNGSTDAGAKRLYAMMDRIKAKRRKATDIAADTKAYKELPA